MLGGVTLQLDNSLRVGDWVRLDDVSGRVTDVHWRFTSIETRNRELVMVPNSWLMKNRFTVIRGSDDALYAWRRAVQFSIEPTASPDAVIVALEHAVKDAEIAHVLKDPPPSAILFEVAAGVLPLCAALLAFRSARTIPRIPQFVSTRWLHLRERVFAWACPGRAADDQGRTRIGARQPTTKMARRVDAIEAPCCLPTCLPKSSRHWPRTWCMRLCSGRHHHQPGQRGPLVVPSSGAKPRC